MLTHLYLTLHNRDISKQCRPRSDVVECDVWFGSTLFALKKDFLYKHDSTKNKPVTPSVGNGPAQSVMVEESTGHKWIKYMYDICTLHNKMQKALARHLDKVSL